MNTKILIVPFLLTFGTLFSSCAILFLEETAIVSTAGRAIAGRAAMATAARSATFRVATRASATRLSRLGLGITGEAVAVTDYSIFYSNLNNLRLIGNNLMLNNEIIGLVVGTGLLVEGETIPMDLSSIYVVTENNALVTSLPNMLPLTRLNKGAFVFSDGGTYDDKLKVTVRINPKISGINPIQPGYIHTSLIKPIYQYLGLNRPSFNPEDSKSNNNSIPKNNIFFERSPIHDYIDLKAHENRMYSNSNIYSSNQTNIAFKIYNFSITNNANVNLRFQVSSDNINWVDYEIFPNQKYIYPESNYIYIRTWTNGDDYKVLQLNSNSNYQLVWNFNERKYTITTN